MSRVAGVRSRAEARPHTLERAFGRLVHRSGDARDDASHRFGRRVRQDECELVAADAERLVGAAKRLDEDPAELPQRLVARQVPLRVVQQLEAVEVAEDEAERPAP